MSIYDQIQEHFKSTPGAVVVMTTAYRQTIYRAKHASLFVADPNNSGVYIKTGKSRMFVFSYYLRLGREVQTA